MSATGSAPGRRRVAQVLLVLLVLGTTAGILRVVVQNNILLGRMTTDVATAQGRAFNLSNGEREALLLLQRLTELESGGDPAAAIERHGLLSRQLEVSGTGFAPDSAQYREIAAIRTALAAFPWDQLGDPGRRAALTRQAVLLVTGLEVRIKTLYSQQESFFYDATLRSLQAKKANERALAGLVALVAVLGVCWIAVLKRRNRSDLARAYDALVAETEERRSAEHALRTSEQRFRALVQRASDLTAVSAADGTLSYVSPAVEDITGFPSAALTGRVLFDHLHPDDRDRTAALLAGVAGTPSGVDTIEARVVTKDGRVRTLEVVCRNLCADPAVGGIVWNARDVTDRRALQDQLSHQAYHDSLTGLPNRALFMRRLTEALGTAAAAGGTAATILVDLDGFKNVNDTLGHPAGDELLQRAAERLRGCILDGDTVARLGGDEFAIAIPGGTPEHAAAISRRVLTALRRPIRADGQEVRIGASIGVAALAGHRTAEDLVADADIAMYEAKRGGKGRFLVFAPEMRERTSRRAQLEQQLSRAVMLGQIEVQYQPIVDLHTRTVTAVEALARWHRDGEVIGPEVFVPIAEEAGLIGEIGTEVLLRAAETVQRWRRTEPGSAGLGVSVNVSGWQVLAGDCSLQLADALSATGLPPEALTLEITESILLDDSESLSAELDRIRALGVRLAMDDFGAGHSSLSSLLRYRVDTLKIDRMFLDQALRSRTSLLQAVAELGRTLGLRVVAEGVETAEQLALVRAAGCDAVQGFLVSRPLPEEDARLFLEWAASSGEISALLSRSEAPA
ncbi:MAG TPA: EAL domain-containing protein [Mycobacteriales bacterium]|nr:EAL domain-containing protein [Mycobacteriales bacterium]